LFIHHKYRTLFQEKYGEDEDLRLEDGLLKQVADMIALGPTVTRRNIQAARAFTHFKQRFEDHLPGAPNEKFRDGDQNFFNEILLHKYAQEQFGFGRDNLQLSEE